MGTIYYVYELRVAGLDMHYIGATMRPAKRFQHHMFPVVSLINGFVCKYINPEDSGDTTMYNDVAKAIFYNYKMPKVAKCVPFDSKKIQVFFEFSILRKSKSLSVIAEYERTLIRANAVGMLNKGSYGLYSPRGKEKII